MIVQQIIKDGATLVDVREELELMTDGEIEGAINIPISQLEERFDEIKELPTPIVFFCRSGGRAGQVVEYCKSNNIDQVHNGGGYQDVQDIKNS